MSGILSCLATSLGFCFCTACSSLLGSILGNDKPSSVPPSVTSGRKRSVFLLVIDVGVALGFQYGLGPWFVDHYATIGWIWTDGCTQYPSIDLQKSCAGNNGVYRAGAAAVVFFVLAAICVYFKPTFNREVWVAKYALFLLMCLATVFIPNKPVFSDIYFNIARIGGIVFIIFQQVILVDMAYNWNDSWVERSNAAEREELGSGRKWLGALLLSAFAMFALAIAVIVVLFVYFTGCTTNDAFISITLVMMVLITAAQLSGEEGNLLSSATVSLWAVFLCYTAVSKNPDESCNPQMGHRDTLSIVLGLLVTALSMCWTGWSYTTEEVLSDTKPITTVSTDQLASSTTDTNGETRKVSGVVTGVPDQEYGSCEQANDRNNETSPRSTSRKLVPNSWKLNIMLSCVTCWMTMALTGWGEISANGTVASSSFGRVGMWIVIASQWLVLILYLWTLVAPRLFPDRDFS